MLRKFYGSFVLKYPWLVLGILVVTVGLLGYQAKKLEVDASAETLLLEDDLDLKITREVNRRYYSPDFLVVTFTPKQDLLDPHTLDVIASLRKDLLEVEAVDSVNSLLDVPLLQSPPKPVKELLKAVPTLESPGIDKELARKEFINSPIYRDNLVSSDFKTTALLVNLKDDLTYRKFLDLRNDLRQKEKEGKLTPAEQAELEKVQIEFKKHRDETRIKDHHNIKRVRAILAKYKDEGKLFLGGVSMIADDLITFVKSDLGIFGAGVLVFLIATLWVIFRRLRWMLLPVLSCGFSVVAMAGLLGMFKWEVTVISSNFVSLQIIITMALTIHLTVKYRELLSQHPDWTQFQLVEEAAVSMVVPCAYAIFTTQAGFASLILSGILPVINFGWMMSAGIGVSLVLTFLLFPAVLVLLEKKFPRTTEESGSGLTFFFATLTANRSKLILWAAAGLMAVSILGASRLVVENSFIDYFKESTEIYQGMKVIDQQLGGTTPLDIVLRFDEAGQAKEVAVEDSKVEAKLAGQEEEEFDQFEEEFNEQGNQAQYWFTQAKMAQVERVHEYLESLPATGKVISLATMLKIGKVLNDGKPLDNFLLALIYNELPERFKKIILNPYVSVEQNEVRFAVRVKDSQPGLRRNELIKQIKSELETKLGLAPKNFNLTSLLVLYNNMLQSLFKSQILTLGAVIAALSFMFLILFRSWIVAFIAIFPNVLSVGTVLGFMGWAGIPLDMMTITIASISVGIAVDDTIHYIHRFEHEFKTDRNYLAAMHRCHESIGYAMYYTSVTIVIGFAILVLSNFIPSIYFGLLTGLAMVIALIAALTLLPAMIVSLKPYGPEGEVKQVG